ncbi:TetR family transcriptional regulator [Brevibacterium litoralis]|uniref:TetR family transcriptional regulator n=1 Tax=Brevibacterium litoralis TaxID=3138935 RepID=UPI0032EF8E1F
MATIDGSGSPGAAPPAGARVRAARGAAGLTLEQVSSQIGVSPATLSLIERDKVAVTDERLDAIAGVLGMSRTDLLSGQGVPNPDADGIDDTRPKVLDAAITCFLKWGYHGTSMRQIAHEGNVSVAGVYHYYASKQQMLVAILDYTMRELIDALTAVRTKVADEPPVERFRALVEALAFFHASSQRIAFIGASEMRSLEEPHRTRIADLRRSVQYMLDEQARAAVATGDFTTPDPRFASRVVSTMCTSLAQWYHPDGEVDAQTAAADLAGYAVALMRST